MKIYEGEQDFVRCSFVLLLLPVSCGFCLILPLTLWAFPYSLQATLVFKLAKYLHYFQDSVYPVPSAWNVPQALCIQLPPLLPVGLISSKRPDMTTLTKADLWFHSCMLQLATLLQFYFGVFICFGLRPILECKLQERKFISILFPWSLLSALNSS